MFVFKTFHRINKYRDTIHEFVKLKHEPPRPHDVFIHLLNIYLAGNIPVISIFFPPVHINFVKQLINKLSTCSDEEVLIYIDSYLNQTELEKNEDLFGLLVAYFYYYKYIYTKPTAFIQLKQQIIIPTNLLKKRLLDAEADLILKQADNKDPKICSAVIVALGAITIPKNKNEIVIRKLLEKIRIDDMHYDSPNYLIVSKACRSLVNCEIPQKMQTEVISVLLTKFNVRESITCMTLCKTLSAIPIPNNMRNTVIDELLAIANTRDWDSRVAAWDALEKIGISSDKVNVWIEQLIANIDDPKSCDDAILKISTINIPEQYREIIIEKLLIKIDDPPTVFGYGKNRKVVPSKISCHACDTLGLIKIPDHLRDTVINKLIIKIGGRSEGVHEAYRALVRLGIPEALRDAVVTTLLEKIDSKNDCHNALTLLAAISIPRVMTDHVLQQLLDAFKTLPEHHYRHIYLVLAKLNLSEEKREEVIKFMFTKSEVSKSDFDLYNALQNMPIPKNIQPFILSKVFNAIDECNSQTVAIICNLKIELTRTERSIIVNKLLGRVIKEDSGFDITEALFNICSRGSLTEWLTIYEKLESISQTIPADKRVQLIGTAQAFRNCINVMTSLPPIFSIETKANIARFTR